MFLKNIYLIAIPITIFLVGCGGTTSAPEPDPLIVNLRELLDMRGQNEVAMDIKYKGEFVEMQGIVEEIHDGDIKILPLDSDFLQMSGAVCKFEKANPVMIERLENVVKGDVGIIRGTIKDIDDFMFTEIKMDPCLLVLTPSNPTSMESESSGPSGDGAGDMITPAPPGSPVLKPDAKPIFLEGSGMQATSLFVLTEGLWVAEFEHLGNGRFEVVMFDENGGMLNELIQEYGNFSGSKIVKIDNDGTFLLQVSANGDWTIDINLPSLITEATKDLEKKQMVATPTVIEKIVEVEVEVEVEKIVEVEVEKIVEVEVEVEVEKIVEVEVEKIVEVVKIVTATPTPTPVISVTAQPMPSMDLIPTISTPTPMPTSTPTPMPTSTPTPMPTSTPTPTPLPTPTPTPVPMEVRLWGLAYQAADGVEITIASITKTEIQIDSNTTGQTVEVVYTMRNTSTTYVKEQKGFTLYYQGGGSESQDCSGCTVIQPGVTISISHTFTLTDPTSPWILGYPTRPSGYWAASDLIWVID